MTKAAFKVEVNLTGTPEDYWLVANATKQLAAIAGDANGYTQRTVLSEGMFTIEWIRIPSRATLEEFMAAS